MYVIWSKPNCPYCVLAKDLLKFKGLEFEEVVLDVGQPKVPDVNYFTVPQLQKLIPGVRTVPQIFQDGSLIGGFEALQKKFHDVK